MSFRVRLHGSEIGFPIAPDQSVLDAALAAGVPLAHNCRSGNCGACLARLHAGEVAYPDGEPDALRGEAADQAVLCQARARSDLVIDARLPEAKADIRVKNLPARVAGLDRLCHDVIRLRLKLPASERLEYRAGQYIEILLRDGRRRAFSIANAPGDDALLELHIRLVPGGSFTEYVFNEMRPKAMIRLEGPFGHFHLREEGDRPVILMGGGTGFAPLKGMIEHAIAAGLNRPMHLFWGARSRRDLYQHGLALAWAERHDWLHYTPVLSDPMELDAWAGETGLVTGAVLARYPDLSDFDLYMSGPPAMVAAARPAFLAHGLPEERLFSDAFEFAADSRPAAGGD